jgi:tRNA 2-selenouridine synthase SelU
MKTEEDEAFEAIERRQGGFQAKRQMAADKFQEPAQEPVANCWQTSSGEFHNFSSMRAAAASEAACRRMKQTFHKLYTTPPQREWVGLTDAELLHIGVATGLERAAVEMISNKLKEKNNG